MATLRNSARTLWQATYTPVVPEPERHAVRNRTGRVFEKRNLLLALQPTASEWREVAKAVNGFAEDDRAAATRLVDQAPRELGGGGLADDPLAGVALLCDVPGEVVAQVADRLLGLRAARLPGDDEALARQRQLLAAYRERLQVEPVGLLHLERLTFTPAGVERGKLVSTVPLAPAEELDLTQPDSTTVSDELDRLVPDHQERSRSLGPVTMTTTVGYSVGDSATRSEQASRRASRELTRRVSSRSTEEHSVSFAVAAASGTDDRAARRIRNPFPDRAVRVDIYQLVRKWQVDLHRCGLRLTYDLTIPGPGAEILSKLQEIAALTQELRAAFAGPVLDGNPIRPGDVTRSSFDDLAAAFGAGVDPPPPYETIATTAEERSWSSYSDSVNGWTSGLTLDVDSDYQVNAADVVIATTEFHEHHDGAHAELRFRQVDAVSVGPGDSFTHGTLRQITGATGRLVFHLSAAGKSGVSWSVQARLRLRPEVYSAWQLKSWTAMREAARASYEDERARLQARLDTLLAEVGGEDAPTLRQIEREEVMKGVLRALLGPAFPFRAHGSVVDFLHRAIEWEHLPFFLYPYFWSDPENWPVQQHLRHPDALHRTFLRAGAARVVLPIRPGFERDFVAFVERGDFDFDALPSDAPYVTLTEEMRAFATTNYPGVAAADPPSGSFLDALSVEARPLLYPQQREAWSQMQLIMELLERYRGEHGTVPTTAEGLPGLVSAYPESPFPPSDPWGNPWVYAAPGTFGDYDLLTYGADAATGGDGLDADIANWAEASLVGRWYEHTPTSALDIAFDEGLPSG